MLHLCQTGNERTESTNSELGVSVSVVDGFRSGKVE